MNVISYNNNSFYNFKNIMRVLNFSNTPWKTGNSLHSITAIPKKFKPFVQNYEVKVFDIAFLKDEIIERMLLS